MRKLLWLMFILFSVSVHAQRDFVTVKDGQFNWNNKPYYFIGANMWYGCYLGSTKVPGGRERLVRELDFLQKQGITNLRVLGASESSAFGNHFPFTIQTSPSLYDEEVLEGMDFLLAEMGKRNMLAVIYLTNYWNWSGGMGQYIAWLDPTLTASVPFNPERKWEREMTLSSFFYANTDAQEHFKKYIHNLVNRKNTFNNKVYRDDPTIMSWQLSNEPRPGMDGDQGEKNMQNFVRWIDETAGYIHSLDANHLVSSGNEGKVGTIQNLSYYEQSHSSKNIDYLTLHIWAKNWSWFDADNAAATFETAKKNALDHLQLHIDLAEKMNKPLVMEEFGIDRDAKSLTPGTASKLRDEYFTVLFEKMHEEAKKGKPMAGANFWAWGGEGKPMRETQKPTRASEYVGDPFVEPQGLNSVFSKDKSTLKIIKRFNNKMKTLE